MAQTRHVLLLLLAAAALCHAAQVGAEGAADGGAGSGAGSGSGSGSSGDDGSGSGESGSGGAAVTVPHGGGAQPQLAGSRGQHVQPSAAVPPEEGNTLTVFLLLFGMMLASQTLLYWWKKRSYRTYQNTTLLGLWLVPAVLSGYLHYWRFLGSWLAFSATTAKFIADANAKPLAVTTPASVYSWFLVVYKCSYGTGLAGYVLIMMDFLGVREMLGLPLWLGATGTLLLFYGLYYGVLGRDCAEMCADRMTFTLGYHKKGDDMPSKALPPHICALCSESLRAGVRNAEEAAAAKRRSLTLSCSHEFHEICMRGWAIVGKKDVCPYCNEKVDLRAVVGTSPWETQSLVWAHLLDALRYLIVWNPLILLITQVALHGIGY